MKLNELFNKVINNWDTAFLDEDSIDFIECKFDVNPSQFIKIATISSKKNDLANRINCLSNTKRAIDCQIDTVLKYIGLASKFKQKNFPTKLNYLQQINVIAPDILKRISKHRNAMEHEYIDPKYKEVKELFEIAQLFVESLKNKSVNDTKFIVQTKCEKVSYNFGRSIRIDYSNMEKGIISFSGYNTDSEIIGESSLSKNDFDLYTYFTSFLFIDFYELTQKEKSELIYRTKNNVYTMI